MSRWRDSWILVALLVALALPAPLAAGPLSGEEEAAGGDVAIAITNPRSSDPSFGEFDLEADIFSQVPIVRVDFYVDGELAGSVTQRPYRLRVDVGWDNQEHHYRVVAHTAAGAVAEETLSTPAIAVDQQLDVQLQQLFVTVERAGGREVALERGDFRVYEDGEPQQLVTFERGEVPITAVMLLDASESMGGARLDRALAGARAFVDGLTGLDQGMMVLFSDRLLRSTPFSSDPPVLLAALDDVVADGGTALNDHLYLALKRLESQPGRPVVVLFSDGTDAHSALPMEEVLWKASRSQALIYWILLQGEGRSSGDTISTAWRDGEANKHELELLDRAVRRSGGRTVTIADPEQLEGAFAGILAELRGQYVLGYYPSNPKGDGSWRKVEVRAAGAGVRLRHREGYVDD